MTAYDIIAKYNGEIVRGVARVRVDGQWVVVARADAGMALTEAGVALANAAVVEAVATVEEAPKPRAKKAKPAADPVLDPVLDLDPVPDEDE